LSVTLFAGVALGQGQSTNAIQLQVRIIPQRGTPGTVGVPGIVTDIADAMGNPAPAHDPIWNAADGTRRFEIQYRLGRLNPAAQFTRGGLAPGNLRIPPVSETRTGALERAVLSRFEAQTNIGFTPPSSPDPSGPQTGTLAFPNEARGVHRPFRGGIPAPAPNN